MSIGDKSATLIKFRNHPPKKKTHNPTIPTSFPNNKKLPKFHNSTKQTIWKLPIQSSLWIPKTPWWFFHQPPLKKYAQVKIASKSSPILVVNIKKIVETMTFPEKSFLCFLLGFLLSCFSLFRPWQTQMGILWVQVGDIHGDPNDPWITGSLGQSEF